MCRSRSFEVLVVFTASRRAETLRGICVPAWSDCVQLPQERMNVYVAGGLVPRCLSIQYVLNKDYFPVKRRLLGWAGRIRGAGGWGPGRSSNGELRRTELQDQLGQGQIFLARGVWVVCNVSWSSLRWAKMKCNRKGNAQVVRCAISVR